MSKAKAATRRQLTAAPIKLITHEGKVIGDEPIIEEKLPREDVSDVITDLEQMRVPQSETAREVYAAARHTAGTIKTLAQGRNDVFRMNPFDLHIKPGWNVREMDDPDTLAHIKYLARDIAKRGVLESYSVYLEAGRFYIANGHLRQHAVFYAINRLGAKILTVPVRLGPAGENEQDRTLKILHTNTGKRLTPWEQGTLMKRFIGWGWDVSHIAEEFDCTPNHVNQMLELHTLPEPLATYVRRGTIAANWALKDYKDYGLSDAVDEVESAITYADEIGAERVMPKHGRRAREKAESNGSGNARGGRTGGATKGSTGGGRDTQKRLNAIVALASMFTVEAEGEHWLVSMTAEQGEQFAKLTGMEIPTDE